ncbi:hypothetical protein [Burkholderia diffusa]|uniref:hypothetical protein n=1 Tax=Burkholderia diffusa TaxID=488732 RepID=UPI000A829E9D|nr:hypothetical protein [Burkholderia diffusa]
MMVLVLLRFGDAWNSIPFQDSYHATAPESIGNFSASFSRQFNLFGQFELEQNYQHEYQQSSMTKDSNHLSQINRRSIGIAIAVRAPPRGHHIERIHHPTLAHHPHNTLFLFAKIGWSHRHRTISKR